MSLHLATDASLPTHAAAQASKSAGTSGWTHQRYRCQSVVACFPTTTLTSKCQRAPLVLFIFTTKDGDRTSCSRNSLLHSCCLCAESGAQQRRLLATHAHCRPRGVVPRAAAGWRRRTAFIFLVRFKTKIHKTGLQSCNKYYSIYYSILLTHNVKKLLNIINNYCFLLFSVLGY